GSEGFHKAAPVVVIDIDATGSRRIGDALAIAGSDAIARRQNLQRRKIHERVAIGVAAPEMITNNFLSAQVDTDIVSKSNLLRPWHPAFNHVGECVFVSSDQREQQ